MLAALLVIPLVGLVFPILLILSALVFDVLVVLWALYGEWHDRWSVDLVQFVRLIAHRAHPVAVRAH